MKTLNIQDLIDEVEELAIKRGESKNDRLGINAFSKGFLATEVILLRETLHELKSQLLDAGFSPTSPIINGINFRIIGV